MRFCSVAVFMPEEIHEQKNLEDLNPYLLRRDAINKQCEPHLIGRAIFHLNQRRGFKSNRKTADNEAGVVKQSIARLETTLSETNSATVGAYLAKRIEEQETVRARRQIGQEIDPETGKAKKTDIYELYPSRALYEQEFDKIWAKQAQYNPTLFHDQARDEIKKIIFDQRRHR